MKGHGGSNAVEELERSGFETVLIVLDKTFQIYYLGVFTQSKYGDFSSAGLRFGWRSSTVEQLICNQQVAGSNPIASSTKGLHERAV